MAVINILDIKNKRKKIDPITNNIVDVESPTVTSPKRTINIADVKSGKVKLTSIIEEQDNIGGQELANKIMGIVKDTVKTTSDALTTKQKKEKNNQMKKNNVKTMLYDSNNQQQKPQIGDKTLLKTDITHYKEPLQKEDTVRLEYKSNNKKNTKKSEENLFSTINNGLVQLAKGPIDFTESVIDAGLQLGSSKYNPFMYLFGDKDTIERRQQIAQEVISDSAKNRTLDKLGYNKKLSNGKTVQEELDSKSLIKSDNFSGQLMEGVGNMLPAILTGNVGAGTVGASGLMGLNSYGSAIDEAYNEGANRKEANLYGLGSAAVETATEYLTSGIPGVSKISNVGLDNIAEAGLGKISNKIARETARIGYKAAGEGLEEGITEAINPLLKNATYSEGEKIDWNQVKDAFVMGAATGLVLDGPANFYNMNQAIKEQVNSKRNSESKNVQNIFMNEKTLNPVQNNVSLNNGSNIINNQIDNLNLKQSAQSYNIDINNETIQNIDKTLSNRGIVSRFDASEFTNNNENAFWQLNKDGSREVVFNPKAKTNDLLENVAVHELYHDISNSKDGQKIKDELLEFAKTKEGYEEARKSLEQLYSNKYDPNSDQFKTLIDEEAVASILGKKLGNQEFVNSLTVEKPSVAKSVYNWVVDKLNKLNKLTGYKSEKLFWKDVKNKFDSAYRDNTMNGSTFDKLFSIQTDSKGNQFVNVDTDQDIFKGKSLYEQTRIAKQYILNRFKGKELQLKDDNVNVTRKTANEYTHPKKTLQKKDASSKMKASTELDNLLSVSKYEYSKKDDGRHPFAKDGWDYYSTKFVIDGNEYTGLLNIAKNGDKKMLYDITKLKRNTLISSPAKNTATESIGIPFSKDNISDSKQNVKSDTKYSMQNGEKNSKTIDNKWQNFVDKNFQTEGTGHTLSQLKLNDHNNGVALVDAFNQTNIPKYSISEKLEANVLNAINNKSSKRKIYLGKANNTVVRKVKRFFGIDVSNKRHVLTDNDIRHMLNRHGNDTKMTNGKQLDLTKEDIIKIPEIIKDPDNIIKGSSNIDRAGNTNNSIRYIKAYDQNKSYVVEVIPDHGNSLKIKTMWKEPVGVSYDNHVLPYTSKTEPDSSISTSEGNISQSNGTVKLGNEKILSQKTKLENDSEKNELSIGDKESQFYRNITERSKFLTQENRDKLSKEDYIKYYDVVSNKESMDRALKRLNEGGEAELGRWFAKGSNTLEKYNIKDIYDSTDVAEGWVLLKRAQDNGDYDMMVAIAKKMREIGTKSGQTIQMYNLLGRLTPEGMVKYATSELDEAWKIVSKNKSPKWIENYAQDFQLTPDETKFIVTQMQKVEKMPDGRAKTVEIAKVQKMLQDKLPPIKGQGIKAWMRMAMLFNLKTQVRNVMGNAIIAPVNTVADTFAAIADRQIAKKTGARTTGNTNIKNYAKGFKKGLVESYEDFKLGVNTRNIQGNRFEIGEGKSFNENHKGVLSKPRNIISEGFNRLDSLLSFVLDAGDRGFYEASFVNSINNQMTLNKTTEVTQDMIDIATNEALSRTWQDNNNYTRFVLDIRRGMNKVSAKGYGLGDVLIPFAKTPANLTKAIVDYSPVGLVKTLASDAVKLNNNIKTGTVTTEQQHRFVQNLGKATAGTMLYIAGMALAQAGITSGANDDDKDVSDFMRNTLGIQPYSIKIGNHTFTYDWAQPVAAPFAITADITRALNSDDVALKDAITTSLDSGFNILLEQSFLSGIQNVLNTSYGSTTENIMDEVLGLPARAVPTFVKQINDMIDPKTRMTFENGKQLESAKNQVKTKIPRLSDELPVKRDTLGREIEKYGGENNIFNIFFNPANISKGKVSESAKEIYDVYQATKDKTIMPRSAPNDFSMTITKKDGTKKKKELVLDNKDKSEFLKISGGIVDKNVKKLKDNKYYKKLNDDEKALVIKEIVDYSYNKAKADLLDIDMSEVSGYKTVTKKLKEGMALYDYYADKIYKEK